MPQTIDLAATLKGSSIYYDKDRDKFNFNYLASKTVRGTDTIRLWVKGNKIPNTALPMLMEVLERDEVKIIYKD